MKYAEWSLLGYTPSENIQGWLNYKKVTYCHSISDYEKKLEISCTVPEIS